MDSDPTSVITIDASAAASMTAGHTITTRNNRARPVEVVNSSDQRMRLWYFMTGFS